jgi:hypothetical protein
MVGSTNFNSWSPFTENKKHLLSPRKVKMVYNEKKKLGFIPTVYSFR